MPNWHPHKNHHDGEGDGAAARFSADETTAPDAPDSLDASSPLVSSSSSTPRDSSGEHDGGGGGGGSLKWADAELYRLGRYRDAENNDEVNLLGDEFVLARHQDLAGAIPGVGRRSKDHPTFAPTRDTRYDPDVKGGGAYAHCRGIGICGVIQIEPTGGGGETDDDVPTPECMELCQVSNAGCIVDDPELFREEEEYKYRYMYGDKQGTCLQYLPSRYPTPGAVAEAAAADLRRRIEETQRIGRGEGEGGGGGGGGYAGGGADGGGGGGGRGEDGGCAGAKVVVAKDRPDAGMGVKLVHLAANLAFASSRGLVFTAGGRGRSIYSILFHSIHTTS